MPAFPSRSFREVTALLNCARPDLLPGVVISAILTGTAISFGMFGVSSLGGVLAVTRGFLSAGILFVVPYAIFSAAGRVDKSARILFAGGDPVLLALGFHDRRLAVGLTGAVVTFSLAAMAGTWPVAIFCGILLFIPAWESVVYVGVLTLLAVSGALFLASSRMRTSRATPREKWTYRGVILLSLLALFGFQVAVRGPGITPGFLGGVPSVAEAIASTIGGVTGLGLAIEYGGRSSLSVTSAVYPLLTSAAFAALTYLNLKAIPESQQSEAPAATDPPAAIAPAPPQPKRATLIEAERLAADIDDFAEDDPPLVAAVKDDQFEAIVEQAIVNEPVVETAIAEPEPAAATNSEFVAGIDDGPDPAVPTPTAISVAAATVGPVRQTSAPTERSGWESVSRKGRPQRPSRPWPETDLFAEWDRRIVPAFRRGPIIVGCTAVLLMQMLWLLLMGSRQFEPLAAFATWGTIIVAALTAFAAALELPKRILNEQLSGGTESLVMANITPRTLCNRAVIGATLIGVMLPLAAILPGFVSFVARFDGRSDTGFVVFLVLLLAYLASMMVAIPAASALAAIRNSSELVRTALVLIAVFLAPVAAVLFTALWVGDANQLQVSQRPIHDQ